MQMKGALISVNPNFFTKNEALLLRQGFVVYG
jgi:hypothetical protein